MATATKSSLVIMKHMVTLVDRGSVLFGNLFLAYLVISRKLESALSWSRDTKS